MNPLNQIESEFGTPFRCVCEKIHNLHPEKSWMQVIADAEFEFFGIEYEDAIYWCSEAPLRGEYCLKDNDGLGRQTHPET